MGGKFVSVFDCKLNCKMLFISSYCPLNHRSNSPTILHSYIHLGNIPRTFGIIVFRTTRMNRKLFTLFALLLLGTFSKGSSILSGELTYQYKGNFKYDVFVRIVGDCTGSPLSQSPITAKCSTATVSVSTATKLSTRDITPIGENCPDSSKCAGGSFTYGFEEITWKYELDLSAYASLAFCYWTISWSQTAARSSAITTGAASQDFYTFASLDICYWANNSTVAYTETPSILICHNQDFVFNLGVRDSIDNGDSLSFHLVAALTAPNNNIVYSGNYSPTRPLNFFGFPNQNLSWPAGFHFDPLTGDLAFRPTSLNQVAVIVVETKEWRTLNGIPTVVAVSRRDFVVMVVDCSGNAIPKIKPPFSAQFCSGVKKCIDIDTEDDDLGDTVKIFWNSGIKGAEFTNNNGQVRLASGQVCWTPHDSDVSNIPYTFIITAKDNACNFSRQSVRAYNVFVRQSPKAELTSSWLSCGEVAYTMTPLNTVPGYTYRYNLRDSNWNILETRFTQTDTITVPPGRHYLELLLSTATPCPISIVDTLDIPNYIQVQLPSDTTVCYGDSLILNAALVGGQTPYTGSWFDVASNQDLNISSTTWSATVKDTLFLRYSVSDGLGCSHSDSVQVKVRALPVVNLGVNRAFCAGDSLKLDRGVDTLSLQYQWTGGDTDQVYFVKAAGEVWLQATDTFGCFNSDSIQVLENSPAFEQLSDSALCTGDTLRVSESKVDSIWYYLVQSTPQFYSQGLNAVFPVLQTTDYRAIAAKTVLGVRCSIQKDFTLTARALPQFSLPADFTLCAGDSALIAGTAATASRYDWTDNVQGYQRWVSDSNTYILQITDSFGCVFSDSILVYVNRIHIQNSGDQKACLGDSIYFSASGADSLLWYDEASYVPGSSLPVNKGTEWEYELLQENNWLLAGYKTAYGQTCVQWDTLSAEAYPQVNVSNINGNFNPVDTVSSYSYSVNASGLSVFFWTVDQGTILSGQGTNSVDVQWNRTDSAQIRVQAWTADGCESETDSTAYITLTSVSALQQTSIQVFPNPFTGQLTIRLPLWQEETKLELLNQLGQRIDLIAVTKEETNVDWSALPPGVYFLRMQGGAGQGQRVVKY